MVSFFFPPHLLPIHPLPLAFPFLLLFSPFSHSYFFLLSLRALHSTFFGFCPFFLVFSFYFLFFVALFEVIVTSLFFHFLNFFSFVSLFEIFVVFLLFFWFCFFFLSFVLVCMCMCVWRSMEEEDMSNKKMRKETKRKNNMRNNWKRWISCSLALANQQW